VSYSIFTKKTWVETRNDLEDTFAKWGITHYTVEPWKPTFNPAKRIQTLEECTVTVRYTRSSGEVVLTSNKQDRAVDNFRALYLAIERMRMIDAAGLTNIVRQAYAQLPPPATTAQAAPSDPYTLLGVRSDAPLVVVEAAWKAALKQAHPDRGGTLEQTKQLNIAMEAIRKERQS
jgi:hypothetical protein